jgi:predicted membrane-bound spermidine synthase
MIRPGSIIFNAVLAAVSALLALLYWPLVLQPETAMRTAIIFGLWVAVALFSGGVLAVRILRRARR